MVAARLVAVSKLLLEPARFFLRKRELRQGALGEALKSEGFEMVEDAQKRNVARRTARASRKRGGSQDLKEFLKGPKGGRPKSRAWPGGAWA